MSEKTHSCAPNHEFLQPGNKQPFPTSLLSSGYVSIFILIPVTGAL